MAKSKTFTITKDFSNKTLEKVFVLEQGSDNEIMKTPSLREDIESALEQTETVCLVAETAFSDELMKLLYEARQNKGFGIYVLTKDLQQKERALEQLKNNCIVREVPHISGNYLLCDKRIAFFFDREINGYAVKNEETVQKLHNLFIYNFWKEATKEFIQKVTDVAEQTFDVAPVNGDENVIIDRSALEEPPYRKCLENADSFVTLGAFPRQLKDVKSTSTLYLDKDAWESNKDVLLKEQTKTIILTDNLSIPMYKSKESWYILNNNFDNGNNTGRFFSVKMDEVPVFINTHKFYPTFTYGQAVGRSLRYAENFEDVEILSSDTEERSVSYDHKQFKEIVRMKEADRKAFFDKRHLLLSDKLAAEVTFTVNMTVRKLSNGAKMAPIYDEYDKFSQKFKEQKEKCVSDLANCRKEKERYEKELSRLEEELTSFLEAEDENKQNCESFKELQEKIESLESQINTEKKANDKGKGFREKTKKEKSEIVDLKDLQDLQAELSNLQTEKKSLDKKIKGFQKQEKRGAGIREKQDEIQQKLEETENRLQELVQLEARCTECSETFETKEACQDITGKLPEFNLKVPSFDKPRYGRLYKIKNEYEYELNSDDDFEGAKKEMEEAGIENVEFVSAS